VPAWWAVGEGCEGCWRIEAITRGEGGESFHCFTLLYFLAHFRDVLVDTLFICHALLSSVHSRDRRRGWV